MNGIILIGSQSFGTSNEVVMKLNNWNIIYQSKTHDYDIPYPDITGIIAGTEPYFSKYLKRFQNLKVISRIGVSYDHIDLEYCAAHDITVTYSPSGPTRSVAENTIGYILMLLRGLHIANTDMHNGEWQKHMGYQLSEVNIGILGMGRIGSTVFDLLSCLSPKQIFACDIDKNVHSKYFGTDIEWVDIDDLFRQSNLVTLHIPLGKNNRYIINDYILHQMPPHSMLVNTSRGALINEVALYEALIDGTLDSAAIDVFKNEPYNGCLINLPNVILTPHISSMTKTARYFMEMDAVTDCIRVLENKKPIHEVIYDSST